nr:uncharacterized protein LOC112034725 [Quercus suber]
MEKKQFFSGGGGGFSSSQQQFQGGYAYAYNLGLQISEEVNYGDKQMPQLVEIIDLEDDSDSEIVISKGPLGLKLRKSDSFVNLINKILNTDEEKTTYVDEMTNHGQFQAKDSEHAKKYLKPLNFNAKKLKIGTWKLAWEIRQEQSALKKKMEIKWSIISAIRARTGKNAVGILEIELNSPPSFFEESIPEPQKKTMWNISSDFTDSQALKHRIHYLEFSPGLLEENYKKLLESDTLCELSKQPFPSLSSQYFNYNFSGATTPLVDIEQVQAYQQAKRPCLGVNDLASPISDWQQVQAYQQAKRPCIAVKDSSTSPTVTNFSLHSNHIINNQGSEYPMTAIHNLEIVNYPSAPMRDQIQGPHSIPTTTPGMINYPYAPMRDQIRGSHSINTITQVNPDMFNQNYNLSALGSPISDYDQSLNNLHRQLLSDDDEEVQIVDQNEYLARIESLTNLLDLEKEQNPGNNTQIQGNITINQLSSERQLAHNPIIRVNSFSSLIYWGPSSKC